MALRTKALHRFTTTLIAAIWLTNGLLCKVFNLVPRHQQIVDRILGNEHSRLFTILIGVFEILMAMWILTALKPRLNAITQIIIIATMNGIEFFVVPDLLLWGKYNAVFALLLIVVIFLNEFYLNKRRHQLT
jgi:uncharacterized membrane protein YphA (DoxX/SURF4 family)